MLDSYMYGSLGLWEKINLAKVPPFIVSSSFFTSHSSHNELSSIVPELCMLSHLQFLKLDHNKLMELPCDICLLTSLEELDVSHNNLSSLPPKLGEVHSLLRLRATHNQLKTLPETFGSMKGKMVFELRNTAFEYLAADLRMLWRLDVLTLVGNLLEVF